MEISNKLFEDLTQIVINHLYVSQSITFKTDSIQANFIKNNISNLNTQINLSNGQVTVPSYCDIFPTNCTNRILSQKVSIIPYTSMCV